MSRHELPRQIPDLRRGIDEIDSEILRLLNRRAQLVLDVGRLKAEQSLDFHVPQREEEIYTRLAAENAGPFPAQAVRPVFREVISACLSLEHPLRVGYLGPRATFSHLAAMERFGLSAQFLAMRSIAEVFAEVEKDNADFGVVPVENSTEGVVSHTLEVSREAPQATASPLASSGCATAWCASTQETPPFAE